MTNINALLKISLDELRMQMLGAQVAFGFQFQSLFQDRVDAHSDAVRMAAVTGLITIVLTIALLLAGPAEHRITAHGTASARTVRLSASLARVALATLAISLSATFFVAVFTQFGLRTGLIASVAMAIASLLAWQAWGSLIQHRRRETGMKASEATSLHDRIDYLLTEARVILPGAQALLGFQLLVTLMKTFEELPRSAAAIHFMALSLIALTIILLITPAAIHRIAFRGEDDEAFLRLGSRIVTGALIPLAAGLAAELYVAAVRLFDAPHLAMGAAAGACIVLALFWYVWPLSRRRH